MPLLIFRAAQIRFLDVRYDEKSKTVYSKINFTTAWTDKIMESMGWSEPPERYGAADLEGELVATSLELIPNGDLKQHSCEIEARTIDGFSVHPIKDKETGEVTSHELRFQITTNAPKAPQKIGAYLGIIGKGEAQLKVRYEAQSELENDAASQGTLVDDPNKPKKDAANGPELVDTAAATGGARNKQKGDKVN